MSRRTPPPATPVQPDLFAQASQGNAGPPQVSLTPAGGGLGAARPWGPSNGGSDATDTESLTASPPWPETPPSNDLDDPAQALAEGLAQQALRWAHRHGPDAATAQAAARAARALSLATSDGHVCLGLDELGPPVPGDSGDPGDPGAPGGANHASDTPTPDQAAAWRTRLLASGIVGTPEAPGARPLLLDDAGRLYLHRDFDRERRLAQRIATALGVPPLALPEAVSPATRGNGSDGLDAAAVAAAMALRGRLTIVSGGPGTGKTTAVLRLLALLLEREPDCRIALAAPTGKAAARMAEAIRERAADLPERLRARLPQGATTLHRLLGVNPSTRGGPGEGFSHHAGRPLPIDLLVIDEASMLDLALATRVFEAVPPSARIVLLGDQDQLAAVESGAVFAELSADPSLSPAGLAALAAACAVPPEALAPPPPRRATGLRDAVLWFQRNHRFAADSPIGRLAREVRAGHTAQALSTLGPPATAHDGDERALRWIADEADTPAATTEALIAEAHGPYLDAVRAHLAGQLDAAEVLRRFDRFRLLCALRAGPRGVAAWNQRLGAWARRRLGPSVAPDPRSPWYPGRPVMVLRNDPAARLFNGDIGIVLPAPTGRGLAVWFADAADGLRAVAPLRLPAHDSAWAMTVHQSQGSEFQAIAVLLPARPQRVLSRELIYTAVTRAREAVCVVGGAEVIAAAIDRPTVRRCGLASRLQEALAAASPTNTALAAGEGGA